MNDPYQGRELLPMPAYQGSRELGFPVSPLDMGGGMQGGKGEADLSLGDIFSVLKKQKLLIGAIAGAFFVFGAIYCMVTPSLYTSTTTVEMRGYAPVLAGVQAETLYGNDTRRIEFMKTTVAKLKLDGVADAVLSKDNLAHEIKEYFEARRSFVDRMIDKVTGIFGSSSSGSSIINDKDSRFVHKPGLLQKYLSLVDINPVHETNLVEISVTTGSPSLSQRIANDHAQGFIDHLTQERQETITANLELLEHQADDLKQRVTAAERSLADYAKENQLMSLSEEKENSVIFAQMEQLAQLLADATSKRVRTESVLRELDSKGADESSALDDDGIRKLRLDLKTAEAEYVTLGERAMPEYPAMRELKAKIGALRGAIVNERRRLLAGLRGEYESDRAAEQKLRDQIETEKLNAQDTAKKLIQYNILRKESQSLRDLYQAVLKQVQETKISAASVSSNVFVTDYASYPTSPSAPKTNLIMVLCTMLGIGAGVVAAILREFLDNTLKSAQETQRSLNLPMLGSVPSFNHEQPAERPAFLAKWRLLTRQDEKPALPGDPVAPPPEAPAPAVRKNTTDLELITVSSPQDFVSEALRTIRAGILLSSAERPPKVIMVTSAKKGEGKTTILSNLAVTLAQAYHRTVVIDCDLRQCKLSRLFGHRPTTGPGLTDLLAGQAALGDVIKNSSVPSLDIIPAGSQSPNPAELLGSQKMRQLIADLSEQYEFVLLDSPPVLPLADSLMLSRLVESVVLVVRSNYTERPVAQEARRRLLRVNARILGVVLNDIKPETAQSEYDLVYEGYPGHDQAATG